MSLTTFGQNKATSKANDVPAETSKIPLRKNIQDKIYIYDKLNFGNGYNSVTQDEYLGVMNYQNIDESAEIIANATGNTGSINFQEITNSYQLKKSLNITTKIDLNVKFGGFSSKNSYKKNILEKTEFNKFNRVAIVTARYENNPYVLLNPSIKKKWIKLAKRNPDLFMKTCGDMFVSKIYTGGEINAVFNFKSTNQSAYKKVEEFFSSSNKYFGNKLSVSQSRVKETFSKIGNTNKKIDVYSSGGANPIELSDFESFLGSIESFKADVSGKGSPTILYVELTPYENLPGFPSSMNFDKIRVNQRGFIETANYAYSKLKQSISNAGYIKENPKEFSEQDLIDAIVTDSLSLELLYNLDDLILKCNNDFNKCRENSLNDYKNIVIFSREIKYPNLKETKRLNPELEKWIAVFETSNDHPNFLFRIEGKFEGTNLITRKPEEKFPLYRKVHEQDLGYIGWNRYVRRYTNPFYEIRYKDISTGRIVRNFTWSGTPLKVRPNSIIEVRLVNYPSNYFYHYGRGRYRPSKPRGSRAPWYDSNTIANINGDENLAPLAILAPINQNLEDIKKYRKEVYNSRNKVLTNLYVPITNESYKLEYDIQFDSEEKEIVSEGDYIIYQNKDEKSKDN